MNILGIETSCDETAIAVVQNGTNVLYNSISSSIQEFSTTGGVIPELAARKQIEFLPRMLEELLQKNIPVDAIAYTKEPGLKSSLIVGESAAFSIGALLQKPVYGMNHIYGHMSSLWLELKEKVQFPVLTVSVSGGHTELWLRKSHKDSTLLGATRDDAIGEAFDKGAAMLGLPYPGGPSIAKMAVPGNDAAYTFPLPLRSQTGYDFSFSGLKTALKYLLEPLTPAQLVDSTPDLAASYQRGLCMHLEHVLQRAVQNFSDCKEIHIAGGVSANEYLRTLVQNSHNTMIVRTPLSLQYCTDNGAMIAAGCFFQYYA